MITIVYNVLNIFILSYVRICYLTHIHLHLYATVFYLIYSDAQMPLRFDDLSAVCICIRIIDGQMELRNMILMFLMVLVRPTVLSYHDEYNQKTPVPRMDQGKRELPTMVEHRCSNIVLHYILDLFDLQQFHFLPAI